MESIGKTLTGSEETLRMLYTHSCRRPDAHGDAFRSHTVPRTVRSARRAHDHKNTQESCTQYMNSAPSCICKRDCTKVPTKTYLLVFFLCLFPPKLFQKRRPGCIIIKVLKYDAPWSYATLHLTSSEVPRVRRVSDASFGSLLLN